jgi:ketosteroid isomerase-like protein
MRTQTKVGVSALVLVGVLLTGARSPGEDQPADEAMKLAKKLTDEGAATFSKADAKAMAAYYTENAIVFMQNKNDEGHSVKEYDGRTEIERLYADLFKEEHGTIQAKNNVEYAKLLAPDTLVIAGTFEPNQLADKPMKVPFYQVRLKQGEKWLIHSLRIFVLPDKG